MKCPQCGEDIYPYNQVMNGERIKVIQCECGYMRILEYE